MISKETRCDPISWTLIPNVIHLCVAFIIIIRRPDLKIEDDDEKKLWIVDMTCPNEKNIGEKHRE